MSQRIVILGAGGDGLVIAEAVLQLAKCGNAMEIVGFLDDAFPSGGRFEGWPVHGALDDWAKLEGEIQFVPALQKVGDMLRRSERIDQLGIPAERWATVIHPQAMISSSARIGRGVYVAAFCSVQPRCLVEDFASLRAGAALGHDAVVSRHAYVGPNAVMCGRSLLGVGAHLGPGAVLLDGRSIGDFSIAGINSAITKNVHPLTIMMGNPAKKIGPVRGQKFNNLPTARNDDGPSA